MVNWLQSSCAKMAFKVLLLLALLLPTLSRRDLDERLFQLLNEMKFARTNSLSLGEGLCLISRIDTVPCSFENGGIPTPGVNEYGAYVTQYEAGADGFLRCKILGTDHVLRPIQVIGSANLVMTIFSPGAVDNPPVDYGENVYVEYNINCGEGRLAFVNIRQMELEPRNCRSQIVDRLKCVDYLVVEGDQLGKIDESCGKDLSLNLTTIPDSSFHVVFRSSPQQRFPGFVAHITCFEAESADSQYRRRGGIPREKTKLSLTEREKRQLDILTEPHFEMARIMAKFAPTAFVPETEQPDLPPDLALLPQRPLLRNLLPARSQGEFEQENSSRLRNRMESSEFPSFSNRAVFTALALEDAPNPIIRAAAKSITEDLTEREPKRLESLKTTFEDSSNRVPSS